MGGLKARGSEKERAERLDALAEGWKDSISEGIGNLGWGWQGNKAKKGGGWGRAKYEGRDNNLQSD